jgi:hypothetical protein
MSKQTTHVGVRSVPLASSSVAEFFRFPICSVIQSHALSQDKVTQHHSLILLFPDVLDRLAFLLQRRMSGENVSGVELESQSVFPELGLVSIRVTEQADHKADRGP